MTITLNCPECQKTYHAVDNLEGKTSRCECGHQFKIPTHPQPSQAAAPQPITQQVPPQTTLANGGDPLGVPAVQEPLAARNPLATPPAQGPLPHGGQSAWANQASQGDTKRVGGSRKKLIIIVSVVVLLIGSGITALFVGAGNDDSSIGGGTAGVAEPLTTVSAQDIQLHDFRYIPVFHKGRIKSLDSYANEILQVIANTNRGSITLDMADYFSPQELASDELQDIQVLFPKTGEHEFKREWAAAELILSWLVEPEKWEHVPFIYATHEEVRSKLDVEIENGVRQYVSPAQIKNSSSLQAWLTESAEQQRSGTDPDDEFFKHIETVLGRLDLFRSVSLQADDPLTGNIHIADIGDRKQFCSSVQKIVRLLDTPRQRGSLSDRLRNLANVFGKATASPEGLLGTGQRLAASINNSITYAYYLQLKSAVILGFEVPTDEGSQAVVAVDEMTTEKIAEIVFLFRANIQVMQHSFRLVQDEFSKSPQGLNATQIKDFQSMFREMQSQSLKLDVLCLELQSTLYAGREAVLVIPTSNSYAVAKNRDEGTIIQPWISLQAVLHGRGADPQQSNGGILSGLSSHKQILQVRRDWEAMASIYRNRSNSNRSADFSAAQTTVLNSLNKLGVRATSARDKLVRSTLPTSQRDPDMLSYTAYPTEEAAERIAAEIKYNDSKPSGGGVSDDASPNPEGESDSRTNKSPHETRVVSSGSSRSKSSVSNAGTWLRKGDRTYHLLIQNDTHWIEVEIVSIPSSFPPAPLGFPWGASGGAHEFNGDVIKRLRKWQPHWNEENKIYAVRQHIDGPELILTESNGGEHETTTWALLPNYSGRNPDSPLIGTWQLEGEDKFIVANGSNICFLSGNTDKRLRSIEAGFYTIENDQIKFTRLCDFSASGIGKETHYHFEVRGDTLNIYSGKSPGKNVWKLLGPDQGLENALVNNSIQNQPDLKEDSTHGQQPVKSITNTLDMTFTTIPAGTFMMGSPEDESSRRSYETQHNVTISKSFYMQTTEVTQGQWKALMDTEPWKGREFSKYVKEGANYPAAYVSWDGAVAYCKKLSAKEGKTYRLPTEAEWEYACRAGTKTTWSFGSDPNALGDYAWYYKNALDIDEEYAHQVGLKKANAFGLYDMHGNVYEWCHDYFAEDYYKSSSEKDPTGPISASFRVLRGGTWVNDSRHTRSAHRDRRADGDRYDYTLGFRLVRELDSTEKAAAVIAALAKGDWETVLALDATNIEGLRLKATAITVALAKGDWETVLALDTTNIEGLRLKATAITVAIAKGDWETVLALDATNRDGLRIKAAAEKATENAAILAREPITNTLGMTLHKIPAGTFMMGSPKSERYRDDNEAQHTVTISQAFYIQTTEVTQRQWKALMGTEPWKNVKHYADGTNYSANFVNWHDADKFCKKLSENEGKMYRLPTEAEWEYSCRAGTQTTWSFGNDEGDLWDYAWYASYKTHQGGSKIPNAFGLYDMHGNVAEWCLDYYKEDYYKQSPENNPTGPVSGVKRVLRSGSWWGGRRSIPGTRSAWRMGFNPYDRGSYGNVGFRVVRELDDSVHSEQSNDQPIQSVPEDLPVMKLPAITNVIGMKLNLIPAGTFMMGSPETETDRYDVETLHKVTITKPFYMQTTEVTQGQWKAVMGTEPWQGKSFVKEGGDFPATYVSWDEVVLFTKMISDRVGETYRLPTEAEWEYACRAGTTTAWSFGNDEKILGDYAWYSGNANSGVEAHDNQVGLKKRNPFGLYDMHGNVFEYCSDYYEADYSNQSSENDPTGPAQGSSRVLRGGSWNRESRRSRSAFRGNVGADNQYVNVGFRLVRDVDASTHNEQHTEKSTDPVPVVLPVAELLSFTNSVGMQLNEIPAGFFLMGSPLDETDRDGYEPQHKVVITKTFYMQTSEVTQGQWKAVMETEPWKGESYVKEGDDYPATYISWIDAVAYCKKLGVTEGKTYRLPTEAEWEYACRAGTKTTWNFGNEEKALGNYAWVLENTFRIGENYAHQIKQKKSNAFGLYDMHGNAWEWCQDHYEEGYYKTWPQRNPRGPGTGSFRVLRGGSWDFNTRVTRSASRNWNVASYRYGSSGFRLVRELVVGDWKEVLSLDPNNADGLRLKAAAELLAFAPETNSIGMELKLIPSGTLVMGSSENEDDRADDENQHNVTINKTLYMQTTEVTQRQWKAVMGTEPWKGKKHSEYAKEGADYPAVYVSWNDAVAYSKNLSKIEGKKYRLPTEAEWEYACRAGSTSNWFFGDDEKTLSDYAWYSTNTVDIGEKYAHQVGLKKPNTFGLYDMHGNVWEWCHDYYGKNYYQQSPENDPQGPAEGSSRVVRGGSGDYPTRRTRSADRGRDSADYRDFNLGFRLVRELDEGDWKKIVALYPDNSEISRLKAAADRASVENAAAVTAALAKGDWKAAIALDPDNIEGLRMQSAAVKQLAAIIARPPINNKIGMTFKEIPAGTLIMGSPDSDRNRNADETQHKVTISQSFYMQTTEVTQGQWQVVMGTEPWKGQEFSKYVKEGDNYPAVYVSWDDAIAYCKKLSEKEGKTYRLPTEAEWEYACRAGSKTTWNFGNDQNALGDYAWYANNTWDIGEKYAHQVGLKKPNAFGLYDMHGNVWEWCYDYYGHNYYNQSREKNPTGPESGSHRVFRGGSWRFGTPLTRSAYRARLSAGYIHGMDGFRLVRELD